MPGEFCRQGKIHFPLPALDYVPDKLRRHFLLNIFSKLCKDSMGGTGHLQDCDLTGAYGNHPGGDEGIARYQQGHIPVSGRQVKHMRSVGSHVADQLLNIWMEEAST